MSLTKKLKLGTGSYPYVNARVRAMKAKLLTEAEYRKLKKMSVAEILEFLQKKEYGTDINELASDFEGTELLEKVLARHMSSIYDKLVRISPDEIQELLDAYLSKQDLENIKTVIRAKRKGKSFESIEDNIAYTHRFAKERLRSLMKKERLEDVLAELDVPGAAEALDDTEDVRELEEFLDRYYYFSSLETIRELLSSDNAFNRFMNLEVELRNISLILRMKKHGYSESEIKQQILDLPEAARSVRHDGLIQAEDFEETVDRLKEDIGNYVEGYDLAQIERGLDRYKMERGVLMLHQDPLSINPVLGYMIAKEAEMENLRIIAQAKKAGLGEEFIDRNIITRVKER